MNIDKIIHKYFHDSDKLPLIEVFDEHNIHGVYSDVITLLRNNPSIELGVLQILGYCLYEILDNVIIHSSKNCGIVLLNYQELKHSIQIIVADDGIGIHKSLQENCKYAGIPEEQALLKCIEDKVTDGKGMGFGLYSTACMINNIGIHFEIHSCNYLLDFKNGSYCVSKAPYWQGTLVYIEISSDKEINPNNIIENKTDVEAEFNDEFLNTDDIDDLW